MAAAAVVCCANLADAAELNHCGCRQAGDGTCVCEKKAKCGCPGQCEPRGCQQARDKAFQKELSAETKKAEAAQRHGKVRDKESAGSAQLTPAKAAAPAPRRKLTDAQAKQLVKLLDVYFSEHPEARGGTAGGLRDDVARAH